MSLSNKQRVFFWVILIIFLNGYISILENDSKVKFPKVSLSETNFEAWFFNDVENELKVVLLILPSLYDVSNMDLNLSLILGSSTNDIIFFRNN